MKLENLTPELIKEIKEIMKEAISEVYLERLIQELDRFYKV